MKCYNTQTIIISLIRNDHNGQSNRSIMQLNDRHECDTAVLSTILDCIKRNEHSVFNVRVFIALFRSDFDWSLILTEHSERNG